MTKHDTWVKLKPGNPYEPISDLFPEDIIPMRDPFPMAVTRSRGSASLWLIDLERLSSIQAQALAQIIARHCGTTALEVATEAADKGGFAINHKWVESMECGNEGLQRTKELADFLETAPQPLSEEVWLAFINDQFDRWIDGNEEPPPIESINDVDPRLRTSELERALKMRKIMSAVNGGGYSVLDVLIGHAMIDALNILDSEDHWSLVTDDDDDREGYRR